MADSINYQLAKFVASYGKVSQIPESTCPEVSFVGRSNVGKSSIMNKLFGRKNLVKVSSTPGKTSNINFLRPTTCILWTCRATVSPVVPRPSATAGLSLSATSSTQSAALTWLCRWWTFATTPVNSTMT